MIMRWFGLAACVLTFLVAEVEAQAPQTIVLNVNYISGVNPTSDVSISGQFFKAPDVISEIWIVSNGGSTLVQPECAFSLVGDPAPFLFLILGNQNPKKIQANGVTTNCPLTSDPSTTSYTIHFLSRNNPATPNSIDKFFTIAFNTDLIDRDLTGDTAFTNLQPLSVTNLTPVNYNPTFVITDNSSNTVTFLRLGEAAKLRFTMTINNYVAFVDDAGARITDCKMSQNADFSAPVETIIDSNGCFTSVLGKSSTEGFTGSLSASGNPRNFVAETPDFENINFFIPETTGNKDLFFQCMVTYCNVYNAGTPGNCGGPHCSAASGRKKRSNDQSHIVQTSVKVIGNKQPPKQDTTKQDKSCKKCELSVAYKATIGGLTGIAVIMFVAMILSYKSLMNSIEEHNAKMASSMMSSMTSSVTSRSDTMSESARSGYSSKKLPSKSAAIHGSSKTKSVI